jgi:hypothetical protein
MTAADQLETLLVRVNERFLKSDPSIRGLRPALTDWMTQEELEERDRLVRLVEDETRARRGSPRRRVELKRKLRLAGVTVPEDASMTDLERLCTEWGPAE